ncbi:MAG: amidohydrolase [Epulopiscium sp. Nele67-Bin001]|nr:MAG: amidohydrolase [Epulopiscium sp. Nele67-Bin001]
MSTVYYNGTIITMEDCCIDAVLVTDGIIIKTGTLDDIKDVAPQDVEFVDLHGKTLMPSFIDTHGHISMAAQMVSACNLSECETFEQIITTLSEYKDKETKAIFGYSYDHNFLPGGKHPTKEVLDQVCTDIPIAILHTSAHMGCVNSKLLNMLNITRETPNPQGGLIGKVNGEPNGYLEENALFPILYKLKDYLDGDIFTNMHNVQLEYLSNGITTAQDGASNLDTINLLKMLAFENQLLIDIVAYPVLNKDTIDIFNSNREFANKYTNNLKLGGYKVILDGSPQGKSAWLTEPYENSGDYKSYGWYSDEEVEDLMFQAIEQNQQVLVHCNGDAAGDQFLTSYSKALSKSSVTNDLRPVMIHCQTARENQLDIMASLNVIPSIFVGHVYYWGDIHIQNLGKTRGENVSPVQSAFNKNLVVNFHQDTPVTKPSPLFSVWAAVNRITRKGYISGPHQRCSVYDALKAVTINGAYAYFEENSKGSIKEGKIADLVILDKNPLEIDPMEIKDIKVLQTIKSGISYNFE